VPPRHRQHELDPADAEAAAVALEPHALAAQRGARVEPEHHGPGMSLREPLAHHQRLAGA
jgi:hypothetical protein